MTWTLVSTFLIDTFWQFDAITFLGVINMRPRNGSNLILFGAFFGEGR